MASVKSLRRAAASKAVERPRRGDDNTRSNPPVAARGNTDNERSTAPVSGGRGRTDNELSTPPQPNPGMIDRSGTPVRGTLEENDNERSGPRQTAAPNTLRSVSSPPLKPNPMPRAGIERIAANSDQQPEERGTYSQEDLDRGRGQDRWARARESARRKIR